MKRLFLLLLLMFAINGNAQLFVSSGTTVEVDNASILYSNIPVQNTGTLNLNDGSILVFDDDYTNDGTVNYELGATPGILRIGSGLDTSSDAQTLQFSDVATENIPFIELNKTTQTATITRGHVRLTQRFLSRSGTLDANSVITDTPSVNTSTGLTFISPDASTTSVIEESTGGNVNNVIIERYIPASNRAFRLYTSSVDLNTSISDNLQEGGQIISFTGSSNGQISNPRPGYGTHITGSTTADPTGTLHGLDVTQTGNPSIYSYNHATQTPVALSSTLANGVMEAGGPYYLFIRGDRSLDLSVNNSQVGGQTTLRMLGDALIGDVSVNNIVPGANDYVFVGNPYQAQVDMIETLTNLGTNGVNANNFAVYDPSLGIHGAWVTVDVSNPSNVSNSSGTASPANEFLQPNQSIFLTSTSANTNVAFQENDKRSTNQNATIDIFNDVPDNDVSMYITLFNVDENAYNDNVLVKYGTYNDAVDYIDGPKYWNQFENIAVETGNDFTNLEKRDINGNMDNILLNVTNLDSNNYQIITGITNIQELDNAFLIDHYLNNETELLEGNNIYSFAIDQNVPASFDANRFEIGINLETLSNQDFGDVAGFNMYPNPASTRVELSLSGMANRIEQIQVVSIDGKLVKTIHLDNLTRYQMDVSELASGVYLIHATTADAKFTEKLIIE